QRRREKRWFAEEIEPSSVAVIVARRDSLKTSRYSRCPVVAGRLPEAIGYALNHWQALIRYASDGRIEIDNNAAERALRAIALGRKNFLFAGSDAGGER